MHLSGLERVALPPRWLSKKAPLNTKVGSDGRTQEEDIQGEEPQPARIQLGA